MAHGEPHTAGSHASVIRSIPAGVGHGTAETLSLGIDATNLRRGGGRTHLLELLTHANPPAHGFASVVVWGAQSTLALLPQRDWLQLRNPPAHERGLFWRSLWQRFELPRQARAEGCHLLFVPGGSHGGGFQPTVTMSQNLLPFQAREMLRYGFRLTTLRLLLLRWTQSNSFKRAEGVIFLTGHAAREVQRVTERLRGRTHVIPHGLNQRFLHPPKSQRAISHYSPDQPYRLLYVSIVDHYKHQWRLVEAVACLRQKTGWPLVLDLAGPAYPPALARLKKAIATWDPHGTWVIYHGPVLYTELHQLYQRADLGLFASSCENMPIILLETMAAGLPVAASKLPPMSDLLGDAGLTFDPAKAADIEATLNRLIADPELRAALAEKSYSSAQQYSWEACANQTFAFLAGTYLQWADRQQPCVG
jgi:glycosyltransferase involved in cell wall biosynthesis